MEVILLEKIRNLGNLGDKVTVKPGYGWNYLIPQGKGVAATKTNIAEFEAKRADLEKKAADALTAAEKRQEALLALTLETQAKASDEGKLYGSIGTRDIAKIITEAGVEVNKSEVRLPEGVLRNTGEYDIDVQLHSDVVASVKLSVVAE